LEPLIDLLEHNPPISAANAKHINHVIVALIPMNLKRHRNCWMLVETQILHAITSKTGKILINQYIQSMKRKSEYSNQSDEKKIF